ncbi:hypothetical protein [Streptomyces violaceoruber]|uniref:Uncharacterized protein n=1 Tax=Streptomyces violaceoruber TaxID=1935 RepID=A0ACD4WQH7_STRVN|nr:hypothetical protein R2E43_20920 [Streptomyces violaceoruber]BDD73006.1 hypothetical protein JCM4020_36260 [Streptomyces coelicolor]
MPTTPTPIRAHCPSCRGPRPVRRVGTATVRGEQRDLLECRDTACELVWAHRADPRPAANPAA